MTTKGTVMAMALIGPAHGECTWKKKAELATGKYAILPLSQQIFTLGMQSCCRTLLSAPFQTRFYGGCPAATASVTHTSNKSCNSHQPQEKSPGSGVVLMRYAVVIWTWHVLVPGCWTCHLERIAFLQRSPSAMCIRIQCIFPTASICGCFEAAVTLWNPCLVSQKQVWCTGMWSIHLTGSPDRSVW